MSIDVRIQRMPVPYYLNKEEEKSIPLSHINCDDLDRGNKVINMGAWLNVYDKVLPVLMMLCEEDCERRITHETIHIILYHLENEETTDLFDVVDIRNEITKCGFEEPDLKAWLDKYNFPIETYSDLVLYLQDQIYEQAKRL